MKKTAVALSVAFAAGLTTSTLALANGFNDRGNDYLNKPMTDTLSAQERSGDLYYGYKERGIDVKRTLSPGAAAQEPALADKVNPFNDKGWRWYADQPS